MEERENILIFFLRTQGNTWKVMNEHKVIIGVNYSSKPNILRAQQLGFRDHMNVRQTTQV